MTETTASASVDGASTVMELHNRALALCNLGQHSEAVPLLLEILVTEPTNLTVRRQLGQIYNHLGWRDLAIEAYRGILNIFPGDPEALLAIAVHLSHFHRHEEALHTLAELLKREPQNILCLLTKGQIEAHLGQREEAASTFRAVLAIEPENDLAWLSYANVVPVSADPSTIVEIYRRLVRTHPSALEHWRALGQALANKEHTAAPEANMITHAPTASKGSGMASRLLRYRHPSKETGSETIELLAVPLRIKGRSLRSAVHYLQSENERLGKLVAQQHNWLGFLDSHLTSVRYGHTSYYHRNMALFVEKFGSQSTYPSAVQEIPPSLMTGFSMNGRVPIEYGYFNSCYPKAYVDTITDDDVERSVAILPSRDLVAPRQARETIFNAMAMRAYSPYDHMAVNQLFTAFRKYPIRGQEVAVYGAHGVFYESLCVWGEAHPTAIRSLPLLNLSSRVDVRTVAEWEVKPSVYDCALAVNIAQEGLGAFGEPLDPDADLKAMRRLKAMVKPGGRVFLVIPLSVDRVHFNVSRIYGRQRLPKLLEGWKVIDRRHAGEPVLDGDGMARRLLVLRNV